MKLEAVKLKFTYTCIKIRTTTKLKMLTCKELKILNINSRSVVLRDIKRVLGSRPAPTILDKNRGKSRFVTQNNTFVYFFVILAPHPPVSMLFLVMELERRIKYGFRVFFAFTKNFCPGLWKTIFIN